MQLRMMHYTELDSAVKTLQEGGMLLIPTDTIWGIACDACDAQAVQRVRDLKKRDISKPFILLVDSVEMLKKYVYHVHPRIETLLHYHHRPLTVIYDKAKKSIARNAIAADGSVGIRIPADDYCRDLIRQLGRPIIATSANVSNEPFPSHFQTISPTILEGVDYVANHRRDDTTEREPSVVVKLSDKAELIFLRE